VDHPEPDQGEGDVDEKNHAPRKPVHDQSAGERSEQWTEQGWDDDVVHGADHLGTGKSTEEREPSDRGHHRAAYALQNAGGHQQRHVGRETARQGAQHKEHHGEPEDSIRAKPIRHPAADGNEDSEAQRVTRQDRLQAQRRDAEIGGHRGHGGVHDGGVEIFHEQRNRDEPRQILARFGGNRRTCNVRWTHDPTPVVSPGRFANSSAGFQAIGT